MLFKNLFNLGNSLFTRSVAGSWVGDDEVRGHGDASGEIVAQLGAGDQGLGIRDRGLGTGGRRSGTGDWGLVASHQSLVAGGR